MILDIMCEDVGFLLKIVAAVFNLLHWVIPIILIVLITFDVMKVMTNGDEKTKKDAGGKVAKRVIYAVIIFLIPTIIKFVFRMIGDARPVDTAGNRVSTIDWIDCFNEHFN